MSATQVILLERVEKLGQMGDVVSVKPGYARNFLLPQKKALRANKDNIAYFEAQKKTLLAENDKRKAAAEKLATKLEGTKAPIIRQASEAGQLFGSVTSKDIADQVSAESGETVTKTMVDLNQNFKLIGLFPVSLVLHPEVRVEVTINIARTVEEAQIQAETGRAMIADDSVEEEQATEDVATAEDTDAPSEEALAEALEGDALEAEKAKIAEEAAKAEEDAAKAAEKSAEREAKKAAKAAVEAEAEEAAEGEEATTDAETAEAEPAEEEKTEE